MEGRERKAPLKKWVETEIDWPSITEQSGVLTLTCRHVGQGFPVVTWSAPTVHLSGKNLNLASCLYYSQGWVPG